MDHEATIAPRESTQDERWEDVPESVRPPGRYPKWPLVVAGILIAIGLAVAVLWPINVPYYTLSPGPVYDTSDFVAVDGSENLSEGEIFFLTVSLKEANVFEYLAGLVDPEVEVAPRSNIRPEGVSQEQLRQHNLDLMEQAKLDAQYVALTQLGYDVTVLGTGAVVTEIVEDSAAEGVLEPGDVIVAIDGDPVEFTTDVVTVLGDKEIGESVVITWERTNEQGVVAERQTTVVLGPHMQDLGRPMLGVLLTNAEPIIDVPVVVKIDSQNIGGPSAGLMFSLQIIDQLTEEDLTGGVRVAGTGTINRDGEVGAIGGIQQKVFGAIDAGATVILVPADNFADAVEVAGDGIEVVRVGTIEDALAFLENLPT